MKITKIILPAPDYVFPDVNAYLIEEIPLLIDTGMGERAYRILKSEIEDRGLDFRTLRVFSTHMHPDHIGLGYLFSRGVNVNTAERPLLILFEQERLKKVMAIWTEKFGIPGEYEPFLKRTPWNFKPPIFNFGFPEFREIEVIHTPGHSPGHTSFLLDSNLIGGDAVLEYTTPNISLTPFSSSNPLQDYLNTLERLEKLELKHLLPAHGNRINNHRKIIERIREHHRNRLEEILQILEKGDMTVVDVAERVSWESSGFHELSLMNKKLAIGETLAHLRYLEGAGLIISEGTPVKFRLTGTQKRIPDFLRW